MSSARAGRLVWMACAVLAGAGEGRAQTTPLRLLVSNGVKAALVAAGPPCEAQTRATLSPEFNTSTALRARAESGAPFDIAFMTVDVIDGLAERGVLSADSRRVVARTKIGLGVREGTKAPDVRSPTAVKTALLGASGITYAGDGASRPFLEKMFERLGIATQMAAKAQVEQGSTRATARVVDGRADMVLTLVSEIVPVKGLRLAGTLPDEFQGETTFAAAVSAKSMASEAARRMVTCLVAPSAGKAYSSVGLERVNGR